jgi:hypothetical protein
MKLDVCGVTPREGVLTPGWLPGDGQKCHSMTESHEAIYLISPISCKQLLDVLVVLKIDSGWR